MARQLCRLRAAPAEAKSVAGRPADKTAGERMVGIVPARVGEILRLVVGDRLRCFEVEPTGPSLGDELCTVEDASDLAVPLDGERTSSGGGFRSVTSTTLRIDRAPR